MKLQPLLLVATGILFGSCVIAINDTGASFGNLSSFSSHGTGPVHVGSGRLGVEKRETEAFQTVVARGSMDVKVTLAPDMARGSVEVLADDNLLEFVRTEVQNGTLFVDLEDGSYSSRRSMVIRVRTAHLNSIALEGSGDFQVEGLQEESFQVRLEGSGDVSVKGQAQRLAVDLEGSGDIDLGRLVAEEANVALEGSGDIRVHAKKRLTIAITGSGDVSYRGHPELSINVVGSGDVNAID